MIKTFELKNLNCAHCANKIDEELKSLPNINNHSLNFIKKELKVDFIDENIQETIKKMKETIKKIENVVEISEKDLIEQKFILENLFCQSCSQKIEKAILNLNQVNEGFYNFSNQILTLKISKEISVNKLRDTIQEIVDKIEDGVLVKIYENDFSEVKEDKKESKKEFYLSLVGAILFFTLISFESTKNNILLFLIPYFLIAYDIIFIAFKNLKNKNPFDENFLMTLATIGAFAIGEYPEAVAVMLFYKIGEFFQEKAVTKSRNAIESLLNIKPLWANLYINGKIQKVRPNEISLGNIIVVNPGESVPLDGIIEKGRSSLDTKALTGESLPVEVIEGQEVLSGSININSSLEIRVTKDYNNSTISKILDLVENASIKKAKTEKFITTFSKYYTPIVVLLSLMVGIVLPIFIGNFSLWFYRALVFLVISCPCALVVSIPLGYFGGIGRASRHGILIKGGNYLDALTKVNKIIVDKTGTLTKGTFTVEKINSTDSEEELIEAAIIGEIDSNHPIATAIKKLKNIKLEREKIKSFEVLQGFGTKTVYGDDTILIGNRKLMKENKISILETPESSTTVHVAKNNIYLGNLILHDEIKEDSYNFIKKSKELGIEIIMLSGDNEKSCQNTAKTLGIEKFYWNLLPQNKVELVEKELNNENRVVFVGDGINDAPVLKRVDIGISMGGVGSDAAIEASDIVIMDDKLTKILSAISISKKTKTIVIQNIVFALGVKILILILGIGGHATMWEAIFADVGVALIAIFNSIRALKD